MNGLTLTMELPEDGTLRFINLFLLFKNVHVWCRYAPRSARSRLPFSSAHTRLVKKGVAKSGPRNALQRLCTQEIETASRFY